MAEITLTDLTTGTLEGAGVFDALMRAAKVHLDDQFQDDRIRGPEYATVYLGQLESVMQNALQFLMGREKVSLEAKLLEVQVTLAEVEVLKANVQLEILAEQKLTAIAERRLMEANATKVEAEITLIPKQAQLLDAQVLVAQADIVKSQAEGELIQANVTRVTAETLNVPKQGALLDSQKAVADQQAINAEVEKRLLEGRVCESQATFDYTMQNVNKAAAETTLLAQKTATEKAQILNLGVDDNSVIGRQKQLYAAQTLGFTRDGEQKAAQIYIDMWKTCRMTDDGWQANATQGLDDVSLGQVMRQLRTGIGIVPA